MAWRAKIGKPSNTARDRFSRSENYRTALPARRLYDRPSPRTGELLAFPSHPHVLRLYIQMRYEWDQEKNRRNQKKHRISFEMAALAFEDECCLVRPDRVDESGEQRWHAIGAARLGPDVAVVLFVVHVYREEIDG